MMKVKTIEFNQVYLEIPKELMVTQNEENMEITLSMEELQRRLEETQSLHL